MQNANAGFIGLGRMGFAMASNLAAADIPLTVFDVQAEPAERLAEVGVPRAETPKALAEQVDILFLCVPSEIEAEVVLFGEDGVSSRNSGTLAVVDTTTMNRGSAVRLAKRCEATGIRYSDCPISGKPHRAEDGSLTIMFGGTDTAFAEAQPYLDILGEFIVHCGPIGSGQLMKAVNNIIYDVNIAALCEVLPLALKAGLAPTTVADVVTSGSARSFASDFFVPRILRREFHGDFSLQAAHKDIVNIQDVTRELGAELPLVETMIGIYERAIAEGLGDEPKSAMVKLYERQLGQEVRLPAENDGEQTDEA